VFVSDEPEYRILFARLDADHHHTGEQLVLDGERDDARIEMTEGHSPFLCERAQPTLVTVQQLGIISGLDKEPLTGGQRHFR